MNAIAFTSLFHLKWKSMMITDKAVVLSNKRYDSFESMALNLKGTEALEEKEEYWYQSLDELSFLANGENLTMKKLDYKRNPVSTTINLPNAKILNQLIVAMTQDQQFVKSEEKPSVFIVAKASLIQILVAGGLTAMLYHAAVDMADGEPVDTGTRVRPSLFGKILVAIVETVGSTGVLLIGSAVTLFLLYKLIKKIKNPSAYIIMKRVKNGAVSAE